MGLNVHEKAADEVPALTRRLLQSSAANYYSACRAIDGPSLQTARFTGRSDTGEKVDGLIFIGPFSPEVKALLDDLDGVTSAYCDHAAMWAALENAVRER